MVPWNMTAEPEHVPFPNTHVATLESADGEVPDNICTNARRAGHNSMVIDSHGTSPSNLGFARAAPQSGPRAV